jgi:hypothetical protein
MNQQVYWHTTVKMPDDSNLTPIPEKVDVAIICGENMTGWSEQLLAKALQLQKMPLGSDMEPLVKEMTKLSIEIVSGIDSNGNGLIEPIVGEGGADTAYEYAYYLAEMPLLPGAHRIPSPASTQSK